MPVFAGRNSSQKAVPMAAMAAAEGASSPRGFAPDSLTQFFYEPIIRAKKNGEGGHRKNVTASPPSTKSSRPPSARLSIVCQRESRHLLPNFRPGSLRKVRWQESKVGKDAAAEVPLEELELIADLDRDGAEVVLCKGGDGERATSISKAPEIARHSSSHPAARARRGIS